MKKALALGLGIALVSSGAMAAPQCDQRDTVIKLLEDKYKEAPVAIGVTNNGGLVEVLSNDGGGTWSIIVTNTDGVSCLVAAGEGWRSMQQVAVDPEA